MAKKLIFLLSITFLLNSLQLKAKHHTAGEFRCAPTGKPNEYLIGLKVYRSCNGAEFCSSCPGSLSTTCALNIQIKGVTGVFTDSLLGNFPLQIVKESSAKDATWQCKHSKSICSNCGTRTPGTHTPGIEVYYFEGKVDLSYLPQSCCLVNISYENCCRNKDINSLFKPELTNFYIDMELNRCLSTPNNSVIFINNPILQTCSGTDVIFGQQAIDPDGDSLSYQIIPLKSGSKQLATYLTPYTYRVPFPYFGAPDTSGFGLNQTTGELRFKPTGNFVSNFAIEVKEWRTLEGKPTVISRMVRELAIFNTFCANQNPPNFLVYDSTFQLMNNGAKGTIYFPPTVQTCYKIVAIDPERDTSDIYFNTPSLLFQKGLSLQPTYNPATRGLNGPINDTLRICWSPSLSDINPSPYYLTFFAEDRICKPYESKNSIQLKLYTQSNPTRIKSFQLEDQSFELYPNPASKKVFLRGQKLPKQNLELSLIDQNGKKTSAIFHEKNDEIEIDISTLHPGIWFVEMKSDNFLFYLKLFHQN